MAVDQSEYFFRTRENGAFVFRIDAANRHRRIEMDQIAVINIRNGDIKPHGDRDLTPADLQAINTWMEERNTLLQKRDVDDVYRTIEQLNLAAHWAQSRASDAQLEALTDDLLMAMHDLRTVLIRKKSERLTSPEHD
ncbi:hypothetical protein [Epibacterium ulvae]|uniref:hypothetical protein n=1 Tax=Epibacterium ulvae TaxID=1156985 RepID=UPI002492EA00|nr:hypothetical protein [Epibacterium ulvae]